MPSVGSEHHLEGYVLQARLWYEPQLEGFGMPVLEAMAAGTPVIVSDASSLPEVAGDAALVYPAADPSSWREAILRVHRDIDLAERLRRSGARRVSQFSWHRTAQVVLDALHTVSCR